MFSIDFDDIVNKLLPIRLNKARNREFIYALLKPLKDLHESFKQLRNTTAYKLSFNAQIVYLEHYLNDQYDPNNRGIYIEDVANIEYVYLFNKLENRPAIILHNKSENKAPCYLRNKQEYSTAVDYIIKVPIGVNYNDLKMRSQVLFYNNAGRRFKIETY